jgi:hypothetical protein
LFDSEDEQLVGGIDKEDGLNEQLPPWHAYYRAIYPWSTGIRVQPWLQEASPRVAHFDSIDVLHLRRRIWPGQIVRGWRLLKLLPFSASINLIATRNWKSAPLPTKAIPALEDFSINEVAEVSCPSSLRESIDHFHENTQKLAQGWRRLRLLQGGLCSSFEPGLVREKALQIGWRRRLRDSQGRNYRHTNKTALVTLMHPVFPRAEMISLVAKSPGNQPAEVSIRINGVMVGQLIIAGNQDWNTWHVPLTPDVHGAQCKSSDRAAYDVELLAKSTQRARAEPGDGEAGLAVLSLALLPSPSAPEYRSRRSSQQ